MVSTTRRAAVPVNLFGPLLLACTTLCCTGTSDASSLAIPLPGRSAGIFIGIEKFTYDFSLEDVSFAVNDAVDLAYSLVIEHAMLPANRVFLLLSGEPTGASRDRLRTLEEAGIRRESARQADIYALVKEQSRLADDGGLLVLSIATHGFSDGGEHLLMAEDSLLEFRTGVTAENLLRATEAGSGGLRLLFLDACRERLVKTRGGSDPRSVMRTELLETLATTRGYAVFSAASPGQVAYSGGLSGSGNGFFTRAILDGLRCRDDNEVKTLRGLASFVYVAVSNRSQHHQQPELRIGGGAEDFGLFRCRTQPTPSEPPPPPLTSETLNTIMNAERFLAVGGPDNVEESFRLYRQAFQGLPQKTLPSLNQGLLARARQLGPDAERNEAIRIYRQLFAPLLAQSSAEHG